MANTVYFTLASLILFAILVCVANQLWNLFQKWKTQKMLEKWDNSPIRDKVILHSIWRCKSIPSISPFGLKLETYLRMAKIPYELETIDIIGPQDKFPWITYNGSHVADSHFCIEFLKKQFAVDLNKTATEEQLAVAKACRIMLEEHFVWGLLQHRMVEVSRAVSSIKNIPTLLKYVMPLLLSKTKKKMDENGIGRHKRTQIYQLMEDDLRTIASILGDKKFICGEICCEEDCAVFGMVAQVVWGMPGSSYERLVYDELNVLKSYCERMKSLYWPDWNDCLDN